MTVLAGPCAITITPMRRRHLRSVLRIEERTSTTPWSLGLFLSECRREERLYLVAHDDADPVGTVVGFAGMLFVVDEGHVTTIAVDPDRQGGRVGTRLLLALLRGAVARRVSSVTLEVRASNEAALALYRRFGLAPAGVRRDYYSRPVEDALVLWVHEIDSPEYAARLDAIEADLSAADAGASGPGPSGGDR